MKLIEFHHRYDFGHEYYVQILNTGKHFPHPFKNLSLFQFSVSWNDYPSWPYLQIKSGTGSLISVLFWAYKFGIDFGFIERTWDWNYIEEIDPSPEDAMPPWGHSDMEYLVRNKD